MCMCFLVSDAYFEWLHFVWCNFVYCMCAVCGLWFCVYMYVCCMFVCARTHWRWGGRPSLLSLLLTQEYSHCSRNLSHPSITTSLLAPAILRQITSQALPSWSHAGGVMAGSARRQGWVAPSLRTPFFFCEALAFCCLEGGGRAVGGDQQFLLQ